MHEGQREEDFDYVKQKSFPQSVFTTFITCDQHHADEVKVDERNGVFIGMFRGHIIQLALADAALTKLRIEKFRRVCPERQTSSE